jgi:hypothetical protein
MEEFPGVRHDLQEIAKRRALSWADSDAHF